eukprot:8759587-Alexandrium_andersonii.AAC.1
MQSSSSFPRLSPPARIAGQGPSRRPVRSWPTPAISRLSAISRLFTGRSCFTAWAVACVGARLVASKSGPCLTEALGE